MRIFENFLLRSLLAFKTFTLSTDKSDAKNDVVKYFHFPLQLENIQRI